MSTVEQAPQTASEWQVGPILLREHQQQVVVKARHAIAKCLKRGVKPHVVLQGVCGFGKGLPPDAKVLTPRGWTELRLLKVGDYVIGGNGRPTKIVGVYDRLVQGLWTVTFSDGAKTVCDGCHLWTVQNNGRPWRTLSTSELACSTLKYGQHGQSRTWNIPLVAPVEFDHVDLPLHPYILGVLLGDGALTCNSVLFHSVDTAIAERVAGFLPPGMFTKLVKDASGRCPTWRITTSTCKANPVKDALKEMGVFGLKSHEKFVPSIYLRASIEDRVHLLQGLMDTDGHCGASVEFSSTSKMLADAVVEIVRSIGGTASVSSRTTSYKHNGEKRNGRLSWRVVPTMPPGFNPFSLPRKADKFTTPSRGLGRWIDSIEPCGYGQSICIKVDSDDGLFVTDDYVVTHNTIVSSYMMSRAMAMGKRALFLAHGRVLVFQKSSTLDHCEIDHGVLMSNCRHELAGPFQNEVAPGTDYPVVVASKDTYESHLGRGVIEVLDTDLIIVDECHASMTDGWINLINKHKGVVIGLSATPALGDGSGLGAFYNEMVVATGHEEMIASGNLVPCRYFSPWTADQSKLIVNPDTGEFYQPEVEKTFFTKNLTGSFLEEWHRLGEGRTTAFYASSVAHSIEQTKLFREGDGTLTCPGVPWEHVDADTSSRERKRIYKALENGHINGISNYAVLRVGFNCPSISCIQLGVSMNSLVEFLQTTGRGFRSHPGKKDCVIIDHGDHLERHLWPQMDRDWSLDVKETIYQRQDKRRDEPDVNYKTCKSCNRSFNAKLSACPQCGSEKKISGKLVMTDEGSLVEVKPPAKPKAKKVVSDAQKCFDQFYFKSANSKRPVSSNFNQIRAQFHREHPEFYIDHSDHLPQTMIVDKKSGKREPLGRIPRPLSPFWSYEVRAVGKGDLQQATYKDAPPTQ